MVLMQLFFSYFINIIINIIMSFVNSLISLGTPHTKLFAVASAPSTTFGGRIRFNGSNWLSSASALNMGAGEFTIECFFRLNGGNSGAEQGLLGVGTDTNGFMLRLNGGASGKLNFATGYSGAYNTYASSTNFPANTTWQHCDVTRDASGILRVFVAGTMAYQSISAVSGTFSGKGVVIGRPYANLAGGYCQANSELAGLRVSNICRYNATFTPSTAGPFTAGANDILVCNFDSSSTYLQTSGTAGITSLANNSAVTWIPGFSTTTPLLTGAYQTTGGSYLTSSNTYTIGTSAFTYEAWCYLGGNNGTAQGFFGLGTTSNHITIMFGDQNSSKWSYNQTNNPTKLGDVAGLEGAGLNKWQHVAITRNPTDNKIRIFLNGVLSYTSTTAVTENFGNFAGSVTGRAFVNTSTNQFPVHRS